ncbi:hypothetical protein BGZ63DRAFT_462096 [Mariannaea sp. PMI_226]|nr:hypothetical protein BGZ63DRAFT_462096 [Mariannaea sp. PMI_226]
MTPPLIVALSVIAPVAGLLFVGLVWYILRRQNRGVPIDNEEGAHWALRTTPSNLLPQPEQAHIWTRRQPTTIQNLPLTQSGQAATPEHTGTTTHDHYDIAVFVHDKDSWLEKRDIYDCMNVVDRVNSCTYSLWLNPYIFIEGEGVPLRIEKPQIAGLDASQTPFIN